MKESVKVLVFAVPFLLITTISVWAYKYFALGKKTIDEGQIVYVNNNKQPQDIPLENTNEATEQKQAVPYQIEIVAQRLYVPWSIVFTSQNRLLVTERSGAIKELVNNELQPKPLIQFKEVASSGEAGLMGMALDPNYNENKNLYVCIAYSKNGNLIDKVVKLTDNLKTIEVEKIILDNIPAAQFHAGCRLKFGPDSKLYITTGDAADKNIAQDIDSLGGKILRINNDGSIPKDNPFEGSPVYSLGHRNPQGIDWHPITNELIATEHGPSIFDGPAGGDEINLITKGANYGWPLVSHDKNQDGLEPPLLTFTPAEAPASGVFYDHKLLPQFQNNYFFGALKGEGIFRIKFADNSAKIIQSFEKLQDIKFGRIREVAISPLGEIYFTTSNTDGRANTREGDDKIFRIYATR